MAKKTLTADDTKLLLDHFAPATLEDIIKIIKHSLTKRDDLWSEDEDLMLKDLYKTEDNEIIAQQLNKTMSAIRNRAMRLKLKKAKHYWKIGQEKYVMENYGKVTIDEMVLHLKKTKWAIINKYRELSGLRKTGEKVIISEFKKKE